MHLETISQQSQQGPRQNLIHLPGEPAGVLSNSIESSLATESRSPATQGGRGRCNRAVGPFRNAACQLQPLHIESLQAYPQDSQQICVPPTAGQYILASMSEVTRILEAIGDGDSTALERLLPLVYDELRQLAEIGRAHV